MKVGGFVAMASMMEKAMNAMRPIRAKKTGAPAAAAILLGIVMPSVVATVWSGEIAKEPTVEAPTAQSVFRLHESWRGKQQVLLRKNTGAHVWSPDGRQCAFGWQEPSRVQKYPPGPPGVRITYAMQYDTGVAFLDMTSGKVERVVLRGNASFQWISALAWSADGSLLAATDKSTIWLFDVANRCVLASVPLEVRAAEGCSMSFSPDSAWLVCDLGASEQDPNPQPKLQFFDRAGKKLACVNGTRGRWSVDKGKYCYMKGAQVRAVTMPDADIAKLFSVEDYFAGVGRPGAKPQEGYYWDVEIMAPIQDGGLLFQVREQRMEGLFQRRDAFAMKR